MIKSSRSSSFPREKCGRKCSKLSIFDSIKISSTVPAVQISGFKFAPTPLRYYLPSGPMEYIIYSIDHSQKQDSNIIPSDRKKNTTKEKIKLPIYSIDHSHKQDSDTRENVRYSKDYLQKEDTNIVPSYVKERSNTRERNRDCHSKVETIQQYSNIISRDIQGNTNEERIECTPTRNTMLTEREGMYSAGRPEQVSNNWGPKRASNKWASKRVVSLVPVLLLLIAAVEGK